MRFRYVIFLRYTPPPKILGAPAHAGVVTGGHMSRDALFRMGIQSGRVSRVVLEMSKFQHFVRAQRLFAHTATGDDDS